MSSEVCPFCGKSFKRLKSHLPHCKANTGRHVGAGATTWGAQQVSDVSAAKGTSPKLRSSAEASPTAPPSLPPALKKRQKLSEQIKLSSSTPPPSTSSSSSSPPSVSKSQKRSLRALIEAAKASSLQGTKVAPDELPSTSTLVSRNGRTSATDVATDPASSSDASRADVPKKKATETKRATRPSSTITAEPPYKEFPVEDKLWPDEGSSVSDNNLQARVFIQDAKSILGRAKTGKRKILDRTATTDDPVGKSRPDGGVTPPAGDRKDPPRTKEAAWERLADIKSLAGTSSTPRRASLIPAEGAVPSQLQLFVPQTPAPPPAVVPRHATELLAPAPSAVKFSNPRVSPVAPQEAEPHWRPEGPITDAAVTRRHLGQVKLRELPDWLFSRTPTRPKDLVDMVQRGWQWYYRRYVDVKKGGVGGLGMLLAGYCVLSYIWSYPHIKLDRWRKHH